MLLAIQMKLAGKTLADHCVIGNLAECQVMSSTAHNPGKRILELPALIA